VLIRSNNLANRRENNMKDLGLLLLGVWLLVHGAQDLLELDFRHDDVILALLGIAAGVLIIVRR